MKTKPLFKQPILVTGGAGFIGRHLVAQLLAAGNRVRVLALPNELTPSEWESKVEVIRGSITDYPVVKEAVQDVGTIFHLAAMVGDWGSESLHWNVTVEGSRLLFNEAIENKSRVILAASIVVYGDLLRKKICVEEDDHGTPQGPYGYCKQAQEKMALDFYKTRGLQLSVVRPANVYGPGSIWVEEPLKLLKSKAPLLIGNGKWKANLIYVENLVDAFLLAASDKALGQIYNACDGLDITWKEYLTDLSQLAGMPAPKSIPRLLAKGVVMGSEKIWSTFSLETRPPLTRESLNLVSTSYKVSNQKLKKDFGYTPLISYQQGMKQIEASLL